MLIQLPIRPRDGHKGSFGHVLIIGGCESMPGAPALSGIAALRSGAGLVTVATASQSHAITASYSPALMTVPLPGQKGLISLPNVEFMNPWIERADVVAIGPGLSQNDLIRELCCHLYDSLAKPMVIDADGLNNLAAAKVDWSRHSGPRILTPHPGEFERMVKASGMAFRSGDRQVLEKIAVDWAKLGQVILVLKGHQTLVTDGAITHHNTTGNSSLATAGSGDVLTGIIAALVAQGTAPLSAAATACHLHGLAGEFASESLTEYSVMATDLFDYLPAAFKSFRK